MTDKHLHRPKDSHAGGDNANPNAQTLVSLDDWSNHGAMPRAHTAVVHDLVINDSNPQSSHDKYVAAHEQGAALHVDRNTDGKIADVRDSHGDIVRKFGYDTKGNLVEIDTPHSALISYDHGHSFGWVYKDGSSSSGITGVHVDKNGNVSYPSGLGDGQVTISRDGYEIDTPTKPTDLKGSSVVTSSNGVTEVLDKNHKPIRTFQYDSKGNVVNISDSSGTWSKDSQDAYWTFKGPGGVTYQGDLGPVKVDAAGNYSYNSELGRSTKLVDGSTINQPTPYDVGTIPASQQSYIDTAKKFEHMNSAQQAAILKSDIANDDFAGLLANLHTYDGKQVPQSVLKTLNSELSASGISVSDSNSQAGFDVRQKLTAAQVQQDTAALQQIRDRIRAGQASPQDQEEAQFLQGELTYGKDLFNATPQDLQGSFA